jgi:hypothetical protein
MSSVEQAGAQLASVMQQQTSLAAAVAAGELWMEAGVAERAAARCDQAVDEIDDLLRYARWLTQRVQFGNNADGNAAAARFAQAGLDYIDTMRNAQQVFANMAKTYRSAGQTAIEMDAVSDQMFRGLSK